jgi:membrane protein YdbS with pleckstrin-like domain
MNGLHPRIQAVWIVSGVVFAGVVGVAGVLARTYVDIPTWLLVGVVGGIVIVGSSLAVARYRRWRYEVRDDELYLERGVITEVRTVVPLVRIQHVDTRRGPLERTLGLASTVVYTAGSRGADVRIPGLTPEGATDLQTRLKRLAVLSEEEDAV